MILAALFSAVLAGQEPDVVAVPVSELVGRSIQQVAARLGATRDPAPAITIVEAGRRLDIYPVSELVPPTPDRQRCDVRLAPPEGAAEAPPSELSLFYEDSRPAPYRRVAAIYVVARAGVVVAVLNPPMAESAAARPGESPRAYVQRTMLEDRDVWLSVAPGRLPLSDGSGFLARRSDLAAPEGAVLGRTCRPSPARSAAPPARDDAGLFQGLSLLPFAWRLPGLNAERRTARVEGAALFATLTPGEPLPGGLNAFLSAHRGVRRYTDRQDPAYSVLVINLGAEPSNNLSRMNAAALIGVRDNTIVWTGDGDSAAGLGLTSALCVDDRGRARTVRPGCTDFGFFSP